MNAPFIHSISVSLSKPITTRLQSYEHILNKDLVNVLNASIKNRDIRFFTTCVEVFVSHCLREFSLQKIMNDKIVPEQDIS